MDRVRFFSGQEVLVQDLEDLTENIGTEIRQRSLDLMGYGVFSGLRTIASATPGRVDILPGKIYSLNGHFARVVNDPFVPDPLRGNITHPARLSIPTQFNAVNYLVIKWVPKRIGLRTPHPTSGEIAPGYTREYNSYILIVRTNTATVYSSDNSLLGSSPSSGPASYSDDEVDLATIVNSNDVLNVTDTRRWFSSTNATRISIKNPPGAFETSVEDHVRSVGTGVVSAANPHGLGIQDIPGATDSLQEYFRLSHPNSIIGSSTTTLNPSITSGNPGLVQYGQLTSTEAAFISGALVKTADSGTLTIQFTGTDPAGLYYIFMQSSGQIVKSTTPAGVTQLPLTTVSWDPGSTSLVLISDDRNFGAHWDIFENGIDVSNFAQFRITPTTPPSSSVMATGGQLFTGTRYVTVNSAVVGPFAAITGPVSNRIDTIVVDLKATLGPAFAVIAGPENAATAQYVHRDPSLIVIAEIVVSTGAVLIREADVIDRRPIFSYSTESDQGMPERVIKLDSGATKIIDNTIDWVGRLIKLSEITSAVVTPTSPVADSGQYVYLADNINISVIFGPDTYTINASSGSSPPGQLTITPSSAPAPTVLTPKYLVVRGYTKPTTL